MRAPLAAILGCAGTTLSEAEAAFFRESNPFGFILFARNIADPAQVRSLVAELRKAVGREDAPVLIDQEGGRVARLRPPYWQERPAGRQFGELYDRDPAAGKRAARLNAALIGVELAALGIDVDCAPVCDVPVPGAHDIIGDRAYHRDPEIIAILADEVCEGLAMAGVMPVIKHIPGHGRAMSDSHLDLPIVGADTDTLEKTDFLPFRRLSAAPWGMTAHIIYSEIDHRLPATLSAHMVKKVIREQIGFDGLLLTDDLSMKALTGSFDDRAIAALQAGCDIVLHCNGDMTEMQEVARGTEEMSPAAVRRAEAARTWVAARRKAFDIADAEVELGAVMG
ncbi:MAG: beta-N-acetylhexosaminidase [Rhodospirillales bacterium]